MIKFHSAFFISVFLFLPGVLFSQFSPKLQSLYKEEGFGSKNFLSEQFYDTINDKSQQNVKFEMKKSPWKAVTYSAILPGAGQFYNHSYWKIPVIAVLGGYFGYEFIRNNNRYIDYKEDYINSQTSQNPSGNQQFLALREFYRDQRDNFIIYYVILYVVNLIDAYVDAQLYDFDVSDKIKIGVIGKNNLMKVSLNF
ncbi:MAG: DUF5683 domain-containing protein [bacterium]|nr:DUF5683 domain-containing protein [bacterium]